MNIITAYIYLGGGLRLPQCTWGRGEGEGGGHEKGWEPLAYIILWKHWLQQ